LVGLPGTCLLSIFTPQQYNPRPGSFYRLKPGVVLGACSINKMSYNYVGTKDTEGKIPIVYTHNNCVCNMVCALKFRHQMATPVYKTTKTTIFMQSIMKLHDMLDEEGNKFGKISLLKRSGVLSHYKGRWLRKYRKADIELRERRLEERDFRNKCFVKDDKETNDPEKPPRLIQFMEATGSLEMGRFTHPMEERLYEMRDKFNTRIFGKGCNLHELADDFRLKVSFFYDPVYVLLDASRFDAHVSEAMLKNVVNFYVSTLNNSRDVSFVRYLWRHTYKPIGMAKVGLTYKTKGTRMSGHMDTGLGNSLITYGMLESYVTEHQIEKYSMSVNGDDSVLIIERQDLPKFIDVQDYFRDFGFNMKVEYTDEFSKMDYCQTRPVKTDYGWVMARSPERILTRSGWATKRFAKNKVNDYLFSLGTGEKAINFGLPIGYALGEALVRGSPHGKLLAMDRKRYISYTKQRYFQSDLKPSISHATRLSYQAAWGMDPSEQIRIENSIKIKKKLALRKQHLWEYLERCGGLIPRISGEI